MRPTLRDFVPSIILLISGVTVAAVGVTGVIRDIAVAIPARWLSSASGRPSEAAWWLRACLADSRCRESAAALLASSVAGHGRALWCGMLVIVVSAAWLRNLRLRARPRQSVGDARFASRGELRRLAHRSPGAWFPLGYAQRWPLPYGSRPVAGLVSTLATAWAQPVRLPEEDLARHVLVVGLTGAHKTTSVAFPVLLEAAHAGVSVVALDLTYATQYAAERLYGAELGTLGWSDVMRLPHDLDVIVLCSGKAILSCLVSWLREEGLRVPAAGITGHTAGELIAVGCLRLGIGNELDRVTRDRW